MSILNVDSLQNRAGVSTAVSLSNLYGGVSAAWVVFSNGTTATNLTINDSFNVISIVDEGTGLFRAIFQDSLGIIGNGYAGLFSSSNGGTNNTTTARFQNQDGVFTPGDFRIRNVSKSNADNFVDEIDDKYTTMMFFANR